MAQLQFAFWDGVGGYAEQDAHMADVYDEHIRLVQRLEALGWHSYFVRCPVSDVERSRILQTVAQWPEGEHSAALSRYCWALSLCDSECAFEVLQIAMPLLQRALAADPMEVFHEIDEIAGHLLRVWDPLGVYTGELAPDRRQLAWARELCWHIDRTEVAEKISAASRRDLQQAAYFLGFFRRVDPKRAAALRRKLDWRLLGATIGAEWSHLTHDSTIFICQAALDKQSREIVTSVIQEHLADIRVMPSRIAFLTPELACAVVDQGGAIAIGDDMALSWPIAAYIVHTFGELPPDLVPVLVAPGVPQRPRRSVA